MDYPFEITINVFEVTVPLPRHPIPRLVHDGNAYLNNKWLRGCNNVKNICFRPQKEFENFYSL